MSHQSNTNPAGRRAETSLPERPDYDLPRGGKAKAGAANRFLIKARKEMANLFASRNAGRIEP